MKASVKISISRQAAELLPKSPELVEKFTNEAERILNIFAGERNRKISERPELVDVSEHVLVPDIIFLVFEADTISL